jgi:hypothetical protein
LCIRWSASGGCGAQPKISLTTRSGCPEASGFAIQSQDGHAPLATGLGSVVDLGGSVLARAPPWAG